MTAADISDEQVLAAYPDAGIDHDNLELYRGLLQRRLMINRCDDCGTWHHPPRAVCPRCWSFAVSAQPSAGRGVVFMHTTVAGRGAQANLDIVTVELDEQPGLRFTAPAINAAPAAHLISRRAELCWIDEGGSPAPAFTVTE